MQETWVWSRVQKGTTCYAAHSRARAPHWSVAIAPEACALWSLYSAREGTALRSLCTLEPVLCKRRCCTEKPVHFRACTLQEKALHWEACALWSLYSAREGTALRSLCTVIRENPKQQSRPSKAKKPNLVSLLKNKESTWSVLGLTLSLFIGNLEYLL